MLPAVTSQETPSVGEKKSLAPCITCNHLPTDGACGNGSGLWRGQDPSLPSLGRARGRQAGLSRGQENMGKYGALDTYYGRRRLPFLQGRGEPESEQDSSQPGEPLTAHRWSPKTTLPIQECHPLEPALAEGLAAAPRIHSRERDARRGLVVTYSWSSQGLLSVLISPRPRFLTPPGWTLQNPVLAPPLTTDPPTRALSPDLFSLYRMSESRSVWSDSL